MATNMADFCPLNDFGHKYFVAYSKPVYEYEAVDCGAVSNEHGQLYRRTEYAYLSCWCGSSIKSPVKS